MNRIFPVGIVIPLLLITQQLDAAQTLVLEPQRGC